MLNALLGMFWHKNINVSTRFDQIHQLFHKILSINIILKTIKGHNSVEKFGKIMCISNNNMDRLSMHKQNVIKIHSLFLKILRKIEIKTPIKGHNSVEKFGRISCVSHCIHKISLKSINLFSRYQMEAKF